MRIMLTVLALAVPVAASAQTRWTRPAASTMLESPTRTMTAVAPATDPSGFTAVQRAGKITLVWHPAAGVTWYLLGGPGMGLYGQQVRDTTYVVGALAPGIYEWTVASLTGEGQAAVSNGAYWPKARATISAATTGSYRVSVAGFRVNHDTYDDPLNRDGWGDEVYASVVLQRFDRATGTLLEGRTITSRTHGDGNSAPERVPQGHASDNGGLTAGDVVPFGWDEATPNPPIEKGRFPMVLWEGPLADSGDVLVLRPTLWEVDGDRTAFDFWTTFLGSSAPSATWGLDGVRQSLATTDVAPVGGLAIERKGFLLWNSPDLIDQLAVGNRQPYHVNAGRDRPIGLRDHMWLDLVVVLDREKIETELRRPGQIETGAGLIKVRLQEDKGGTAPLNGDYTLYLRVERMP
jgi:hypothetical protein